MRPMRPTLLLILLFAGCAYTSRPMPTQDASITNASHSAQRIDDKAVVIEKWLNAHP